MIEVRERMARRSSRSREAAHAGRYQTLAGPDPFAALRESLRVQAAEQQAQRQAERAKGQTEAQAREARRFEREMRDVTPLRIPTRAVPQATRPAPLPRQRQLDERAVLEASLSDEIDIERYLETDDALSYHRDGVGPDVPRRLRRGEWTVRAQLDLHGMRVDEARSALAEFLATARQREQRCLRIIHGKGLGSANKEPVLKGKVMRWLIQRADVLAFCQARPNDGGSGALVVLISLD
ncbi:MAG: Smr/MutS family protein [Burkholderiaceae bacterium]|nr:Smr/MutS family protein [Burkholderiaceae bacterium]